MKSNFSLNLFMYIARSGKDKKITNSNVGTRLEFIELNVHRGTRTHRVDVHDIIIGSSLRTGDGGLVSAIRSKNGVAQETAAAADTAGTNGNKSDNSGSKSSNDCAKVNPRLITVRRVHIVTGKKCQVQVIIVN